MKTFKAVATVGCLALFGAMFAPTASADEFNRKTVMTFSGPVEIPGVHLAGWGVLPAGTYVFKILDSQSDRHIVQIFNAEETRIYATILAIPNYRVQVTDKTVVTFKERPAGQPQALHAWFYPGRNWGEEFVYPKARALELAKGASTPVLYAEYPAEVTEPIQSVATPTQRTPAPIVRELTQAPVRAVTPAGEDVQLAQAVTPPPAEVLIAQAPIAPRVEERTLPGTASALPLIALFGLLTLGGAFLVRRVSRQLQ
jgi:hypothetical protein